MKKITSWEPKSFSVVLSQLCDTFSLSNSELEAIKNSIPARLIAALPFLSNCKDPHRMSLSHLSILLLAHRCKIFDHQENETIRERLTPIMNFPDANPDVINAGFILLELASLNDHKQDEEEDRKRGKYNPITSQEEYELLRKSLIKEFHSFSEKIQEIFRDYYLPIMGRPFWL